MGGPELGAGHDPERKCYKETKENLCYPKEVMTIYIFLL